MIDGDVKPMDENLAILREITCVNCPIGCTLSVRLSNCSVGCTQSVQLSDGQIVSVSGQQCPRGEQYARSEITDPRRMLTTLVVIDDRKKPLPVRSRTPIPKSLISRALLEIHRCALTAPVHAGDIVVADLCGTGIAVIATADVL